MNSAPSAKYRIAAGNKYSSRRIYYYGSKGALERQGVLPACRWQITEAKGDVMKKLAFWSLCLSLGMFIVGCSDTTKKKDMTKSSTTVTQDKDTGKETVKTEEESQSTDSETGAETETKTEEETTTKPADEDGNATDNATDATGDDNK